MKKLFKQIIIFFLTLRAKKILASGAKIVAVTGSVGKTTCKDAIVHLLSTRYDVLASSEGFNTNIGILLSLLGENESGFSSPIKWIQILWRVFCKKLRIPDVIVLEYGVDTPGDMDDLLAIAQPHYAIVTEVAAVHLGKGQFESIEQIADEKMKLPKSLGAHGVAILNNHNSLIRDRIPEIRAQIRSYGNKTECTDLIKNANQLNSGMTFTLTERGKDIEFFVPFFGTYHTSVLVPAILLAREFNISVTESAEILKKLHPPAGRGRILLGKNTSVIWDSSYNSSAKATAAALKTLPKIPAQRRWALLGNMNELGEHSEQFHEELGKTAAEFCDEIFFVGKESESFQKGVGVKKPLTIFRNAPEAGQYIAPLLQKGDLILVKGSQNGVFLERAVEKMLKTPEDAHLLCRRGEEWKKK